MTPRIRATAQASEATERPRAAGNPRPALHIPAGRLAHVADVRRGRTSARNPARTAVSTGALVDRAGTAITVGAPSPPRRHRSFHNNSNASGGGAASKHVFARDN